MEKIKFIIFIFLFLFVIIKPATADSVAGSSATIISSNKGIEDLRNSQSDLYLQKRAIKKILEKYQSPMIDSVDVFISACQKYELDCYLLPSIATLESTLGRFIYPDSFNAFGWGGGYIMFENWDQGINTVAKGLRKNYLNKGAVSIEEIGPIYSESSTWAQRVQSIKKMFEKVEKEQLYLSQVSVEL
ncbi:MAG: hypothetical protein HYW86_03455 [Candidatus Roizmanbacteria bacterium]|nr:MAG: hypothetical protein HYW86_03455 [Candidatus Roizmanbacteria bacterium]